MVNIIRRRNQSIINKILKKEGKLFIKFTLYCIQICGLSRPADEQKSDGKIRFGFGLKKNPPVFGHKFY